MANNPKYRVLCWGACKTPGNGPCGLNYPPGKRANEGDVVDDLPAMSVGWLTRDGYIEKVKDEPAHAHSTKGGKQ